VTNATALIAEMERSPIDIADAQARIDAINHTKPIYASWVVILGLSLTAASLSRLFGGDWPTFGVVFVAGAVGTWLRLEIGRRHGNVFFGAFAGALLSGVIGGVAAAMHLSTMPALCFLAPGMIIVPGVPLVNGVQDFLNNHINVGIARLAFAAMLILAIALGLAAATLVTGIALPVEESSRLPPLLSDAVFSALAAVGYSFLFQVPPRLAWVGVLCGMVSHSTRTLCLTNGLDIAAGSLIGSLAAGILAGVFARRFSAPVSAFAFPGVVAMMPGAYAFRAVVGYLEIVRAGSAAPADVVFETLSLSVTSILLVLAIAIGVVAPLAFFPKPKPKLPS
jgi:uncharacterized membrane protein YjjB (DUF3815 family)